jgi:hypothetical protein
MTNNYDSQSTPNTIKLKLRDEPFEKEAALASGKTITPGQVLEYTTGGVVQPQSVKHAQPKPYVMIGVEFGIDGRGIDDQYKTSGETVVFNYFEHGEEAYCFLAIGENIALGDLLDVDASGNLVAGTGYTSGECFRALEAVNNSAGSAPARIRVEVL